VGGCREIVFSHRAVQGIMNESKQSTDFVNRESGALLHQVMQAEARAFCRSKVEPCGRE
jgi:hypothetical protein